MQNKLHRRDKRISHARGKESLMHTEGALVSRRAFLRGAVGIAAATGAGAIAASLPLGFGETASEGDADALSPSKAWAADDPNTLQVSSEQVFTTDDCEYIDDAESALEMVAQASLPYGTVVWVDDDNVACCLLPQETSDPLLQVGMLSLAGGNVETVLSEALGHDDGFQILDARLNSTGVVWVEADILNDKWRVCTARLVDGAAVSQEVAEEGNASWETPSISVSGGFAFWQMLPVKDGDASEENSLLKRIPLGAASDDAKVVLESSGRMACSLSSTSTGIACAPRADAKGVYYELTHVNAESGQVTDTMVLPASMKPTFVGFGDTGFSFAFEDIYNYGDGISNLGTYTPAVGDVDGEWLRFARTPYTCPAWSGGLIFVKSTSVVAAIDTKERRYYTISPENASQGYGEFLASSGSCAHVVTYNNIDYTPLNKARITECNVRVWRVR